MNLLSLPIDVPWKRFAVSEDMYATSLAAALPLKWRSSLAVFYYQPKLDLDEEAEKSDEITTFLKVSATVTGYQPEGVELDQDILKTSSFQTTVVENFESLVGHYYPAYSALIHVAVFPQGGDWGTDRYPYLSDFEPKKRELLELVTDTGEAVTQSATNLNVRKGSTSTDSLENVNIDRGGSSSGAANVSIAGIAGIGASGSSSTAKEVGTRATMGTQNVNLMTTDASREKRESYSHSTSLTQLYELLDSYHMGTNRALFFVNARPHLVQSDYTFVNGPRKLEGIQEFFVVVRRPKEMTDFCVKAVLETAHLRESETQSTTNAEYDLKQLSNTYRLFSDGTWIGGDGEPPAEGNWDIPIPGGYVLDLSRGGGTKTITISEEGTPKQFDVSMPPGVSIDNYSGRTHKAPWVYKAIPQITAYDTSVNIKAAVKGWGGYGDTAGKLDLKVTVYYRSANPVKEASTTVTRNVDLFLTGRQVIGCTGWTAKGVAFPVSVTYEKTLPHAVSYALGAKGSGREAVKQANAFGRLIRDEIIASFRPNRRYPVGEVDFMQTNFAFRDLTSGLKRPKAEKELAYPLKKMPKPPAELRNIITNAPADLTAGEVLGMTPMVLADKLKCKVAEASKIRNAILGLRTVLLHMASGSPKSPTGDQKSKRGKRNR